MTKAERIAEIEAMFNPIIELQRDAIYSLRQANELSEQTRDAKICAIEEEV